MLVEVVRRDSDIRVARLDEMLGEAKTVLDVLVSSLTDLQEEVLALGDGFALQALSDPELDDKAAVEAGAASARFLLVKD